MTPSGVKAEKLYSHKPHNGNGDFTHDRNLGTATRVNKDGLIESVAEDVPRLDYPIVDGVVQDCPALLLEPVRTQLIEYSEDFSQTFWTKINSSITSNQVISPDGTLNADKLVEDTQNDAHITTASPTITLGNNTFSVFAKAGERSILGIEFPTNGILVSFDLVQGVYVNQQANPDNYSITPYSNGWYRIDITENLTASSIVSLSLRDDSGNRVYQGDGTSGLYIWGAQLESGSYATSYIPNDGTTATVTRNADVCDSAGTSAEFNDSEGVLYAESSVLDTANVFKNISINNDSLTERVTIGFYGSAIYGYVHSSSTAVLNSNYTPPTTLDANKVAIKYKANDFALWVNGFEVATDTSGSAPTGLTQVDFDAGNGTQDHYGKTKELAVFKEALTDSELEDLTSWDSFNDMAKGQEYTIE